MVPVDTPVEAMVAIERKSGALADQDAIGAFAAEKLVGDLDGLVEHIME